MASFEYIICINLEATCWEKRDLNNAEIIEIGAVLLNLKTGLIESEFQEYVKPTRRPILSEFCINFTGITQNLIDRQATFPVVYHKFITWLARIKHSNGLRFTEPNMQSVDSNCNATFCSWTNWNFGHFLRLDCQNNAQERPVYLKAWIDARKAFESKYVGRFTFATALKRIGIGQVRNTHSAIEDAKSLAEMMKHLYNSGAKFSRVTDHRM